MYLKTTRRKGSALLHLKFRQWQEDCADAAEKALVPSHFIALGLLPACHWHKSDWTKYKCKFSRFCPCFDHRIIFSTVDSVDAFTVSTPTRQKAN